MSPINPYGYLMAKGEGNKGASYKYTWRPDWRLPPGVKQGKVMLQLVALLGVAAVPVYGIQYLTSRGADGEAAKVESHYMVMKKQAREERMKWIQSDDMPYK